MNYINSCPSYISGYPMNSVKWPWPNGPQGQESLWVCEVAALQSRIRDRLPAKKKTLMLGKIEGKRRGRQRMRWLDGIIDSVDMSFSKFWEIVKDRQQSLVCCSPWGRKESDIPERLNYQPRGKPHWHLFQCPAVTGRCCLFSPHLKDATGAPPEEVAHPSVPILRQTPQHPLTSALFSGLIPRSPDKPPIWAPFLRLELWSHQPNIMALLAVSKPPSNRCPRLNRGRPLGRSG